MSSFEQVASVVLFTSATLMLIALWRTAHQNRFLGICLLVMAFMTFLAVGLHLERLREGSRIAILNTLTAVLLLAAGILSLRKRAH